MGWDWRLKEEKGRNAQSRAEKREKEEGNEDVGYLPYLVILMQKENWYTWNSARKEAVWHGRDLLNRSCCSCQKRRDFYCLTLAWQRERKWFHGCSHRLEEEGCSRYYGLSLMLP